MLVTAIGGLIGTAVWGRHADNPPQQQTIDVDSEQQSEQIQPQEQERERLNEK
jgi:hypothetical protein